MLIGLDTRRVLFAQRGVVPKLPAAAHEAGGEVKQGLRGFMVDLQSRPMTNTKKKRTLDEISALQATATKAQEGHDPAASCEEVAGRFRFKFKEGHSKNFRREVTFDWFINKK